MKSYANPAIYVFLAALSAFILLLLINTLSVPLVSNFYFMYSTQANGVKFGIWGCLDKGGICLPHQFGYTWDPEIPNHITKGFAFYPISAVLSFLTLVATLPILHVSEHTPPTANKVFEGLAWISFACSTLGFLFMIGIYGSAKRQFEKQGFSVQLGNLFWMSLTATLLLLIVAIGSRFLPPPEYKIRRYSYPWQGPINIEAAQTRELKFSE